MVLVGAVWGRLQSPPVSFWGALWALAIIVTRKPMTNRKLGQGPWKREFWLTGERREAISILYTTYFGMVALYGGSVSFTFVLPLRLAFRIAYEDATCYFLFLWLSLNCIQ